MALKPSLGIPSGDAVPDDAQCQCDRLWRFVGEARSQVTFRQWGVIKG